jgi:hypothetical protein
MGPVADEDVEGLLSRSGRAALPLGRLLLLYLNPFPLFKDASRGPIPVRERALSYNRSLRGMLVTYMRRWILIAAASFAGIAPAEALAAEAAVFIYPAAAFAVGFCVAVAALACIAAAYLLLGSPGGAT